ncbi:MULTISPECIES: general secretion pathway protein GspB [unclassified Duganella]|uniref:general secretion pathway protein GspB n=1 Tax=unclassified Duganella TaxID=2636909 RepID=UPI00088BA225|nr:MULTISPECIES: general secretion pathway protein GspB [unclassified Duganella]SDH31261.1 general secretion pathway protein B [Duganella sp. OV458]SDK48124.1 general secretion pathway protein B [Duganella sp. OV510]
MSYILEALKKAQAERQLGNAPTIHAPTLQTEQQRPAARFSMPMLAAVVGMAAVIGVLLVLLWRPSAPDAAVVPASAPVAAASQPAAPRPAQPALSIAPAEPTPLPAPDADLPPSVANLARATASAPVTATVPAPAPITGAPQPAAPIAKPAGAPEEPVVNLRELPEPIQRSIPPVTVGGYIYSKNAADRLLLVDKVLRREGDEVAPGLILEKLQPKEAVFNFKGYRYRVPY